MNSNKYRNFRNDAIGELNKDNSLSWRQKILIFREFVTNNIDSILTTNSNLKLKDFKFLDKDNNPILKSFIDSLPLDESWSLEVDKMQCLWKWGTHNIYWLKDNSNYVLKINNFVLNRIIKSGWQDNEKLQIEMENYIREESDKYEKLYSCFGKWNCLVSSIMKKKLSITGETGNKMVLDWIVVIQEKSDVFENNDRLDFSFWYIEWNSKSKDNTDAYNKLNQSTFQTWIFDEKAIFCFSEKIKIFFEKIDENPSLKITVIDFLNRFKKYYEETWRFIDLVWQENVLFYKQWESWKFQLGSVIKNENRQRLENVLSLLENNPEKLNLEEQLKSNLKNQLALIRLLNATWMKVWIWKVIDINLTQRQLNNIELVNFNK